MGLATARRLIHDGIDVTIGTRRGGDMQAVGAILGPQGIAAYVAPLDVRSSDSVDACVADVVSRRGGVDMLVNAAGVYEEAPVIDHPDAVWDDQIDTNLSGTFRTICGVMPHMKAAGWGRIVNLTSKAAQTGLVDNAAHCASKAGLLGLGRCVSLEGAAHGITCASISPTWVETEMLKQFIEADMTSTGKSREEVRASYAAGAITMTDYQVTAGSPW